MGFSFTGFCLRGFIYGVFRPTASRAPRGPRGRPLRAQLHREIYAPGARTSAHNRGSGPSGSSSHLMPPPPTSPPLDATGCAARQQRASHLTKMAEAPAATPRPQTTENAPKTSPGSSRCCNLSRTSAGRSRRFGLLSVRNCIANFRKFKIANLPEV